MNRALHAVQSPGLKNAGNAIFSRFVCLVCSVICAASPTLLSQGATEVDLQMYPGLTITGPVGTVYSIEYCADVSATNGWKCVDFVRLPATSYFWVDRNAPAGSRRFYRAVAEVRTNLVFIPPGTFVMGSPTNEVDRGDNEGPQTEVTLTTGFYMAQFKVTQRDYERVTSRWPSVFTGDFDRPVETISWDEAVKYCELLTKRERAAGRIPPNSVYRLPTEAEWEYACRARTSTRFSYGDDPGYTNLAKYAWYLANSAHTTHVVGEKLPNPWGLYDIHGGLWEWCYDWYGTYPGGSVVDPQGPATGRYRVFRGGSWGCQGGRCRSAVREADPEGQTGYVGFRVVLAPGLP
jgi:formylglycine-generating enzyme required for sulfatase activity